MPDSKISLFIVDDESLARDRLKRLLEHSEIYQVTGEAENGIEALQMIPKIQPDIVLLDIRMPGEDGLSVAAKLSQSKHTPAIIFCTAYDEYAISAFKFNAIGYLLKPVRKEELNQALANATKLNQLQVKQALQQLESAQEQSKQLVANTWQGQELIPVESILYIRSDQKYVTIVHQQGETLSDQTLKDLEIEYDIFIRAHRNTLVNKTMISGLLKTPEGQHEITLRNSSQKIPVSRRHVPDVKDFLSSF